MVRYLIAVWVVLIMSSLTAAAASAPTTRMASLIEEIVPANGLVRAPYEPARYDPGIQPAKDESVTMDKLRALAAARQKRLEAAWKEVSVLKTQPLDAEAKAQLLLLAYAFDQGNFAYAAKAAEAAGPTARLCWARLPLAECRFDEAIIAFRLQLFITGREGSSLFPLPAHADVQFGDIDLQP